MALVRAYVVVVGCVYAVHDGLVCEVVVVVVVIGEERDAGYGIRAVR